jgi:hypothetical protein
MSPNQGRSVSPCIELSCIKAFAQDTVQELPVREPTLDYDLCFDRRSDGQILAIDTQDCGNEGRFINDYRGVAVKPNVEFKD